jgi:hypothetical protein
MQKLHGLVSYSDDEDEDSIQNDNSQWAINFPKQNEEPVRNNSLDKASQINEEIRSQGTAGPSSNPEDVVDDAQANLNDAQPDDNWVAVVIDNVTQYYSYEEFMAKFASNDPASPNSKEKLELLLRDRSPSPPDSNSNLKAEYEPPECSLFKAFPKSNPGLFPSSTGSISSTLQGKFENWFNLQQEQGIHFNDAVLNSREFHNPSIHLKLLDIVGLDEFGSNFDKGVYDPKAIPSDSFAETLGMFVFTNTCSCGNLLTFSFSSESRDADAIPSLIYLP